MGMKSLREWLENAPPGTLLAAEAVLAALLSDERTDAVVGPETPAPLELTWKERLWLVPAETRLNVSAVCEALGRSRSWLYSHLGVGKKGDPIPHRKLDGELVFTAGELRAWLRLREKVVAAGPMESTPGERRLSLISGERAG